MAIKRPVKMLLYAPPGTGKSVFALRFPKPFFICTDGNYEWLLDFGAREEDHINIKSFAEFEKLVNNDFAGYDTIVVDLLEDIYKWNEYEYCKKLKVDHLSDAGGFGKGWDITRNRLFVACSKLLSLPKNIIFLSHESSYTEKDRKGNEKTKYQPSNLMSEKFMIMLEGRLRYVLRAKFEDEVMEDGKIVTHRVLSLIPKSDEYGIHRGIDTSLMPEDIELDANTFLQVIGYVNNDVDEPKAKVELTQEQSAAEPLVTESAPSSTATPEDKKAKLDKLRSKIVKKVEQEPLPTSASVEQPIAQPVKQQTSQSAVEYAKADLELTESANETVEEQAEMPVEESVETPTKMKIEVVEEKVEQVPVQNTTPISNEEKVARIKAKLAALKKA